ncbi:MAG: hypothetical protein MJK15_00735 [Colwellia sp.]|nr:hypothetical protein [Colwellia sp.]
MIKIKQAFIFGQTVTVVIDTGEGRTDKILDIRKGDVSEHAKTCARYHARRQNQGMIKIERLDSFDAHISAVEE